MAANTILLIEDNPDDEELTLRALSRYHINARIVVVRGGPQALDWIAHAGAGAPALILLGMTPAPDVLKTLQESRIPIVAVQKPVDASALADAVASLPS